MDELCDWPQPCWKCEHMNKGYNFCNPCDKDIPKDKNIFWRYEESERNKIKRRYEKFKMRTHAPV